MLPYHISFIFIFLMSLIIDKIPNGLKQFIYSFIFLFLLIYVGFRYEVGGDWFSYLNYIQDLTINPSKFFNFRSDWGFTLLLYIFFDFSNPIYIVNFICAFIFVSSIFLFAFQQNKPCIVIFVALPYIINVLAMGYTRQSVAYAFLIFSIIALKKNKNLFFILLIIIGSLFHKSLILFSILYFVNLRFNFRAILMMILLFLILILLLIYKLDTIQFYYYYYIGEGQHSESKGTIFRYLINLIPCLLIIYFGTDFLNSKSEKKLVMLFSLFTICGLFLFQLAPTAFDRIGLYLTLIQLYVYSNLDIIIKNLLIRRFVYFFVYSLYFIINYVWLNFSTYRDSWLPYNLIFYQFY